jgi:hypothetical protein
MFMKLDWTIGPDHIFFMTKNECAKKHKQGPAAVSTMRYKRVLHTSDVLYSRVIKLYYNKHNVRVSIDAECHASLPW